MDAAGGVLSVARLVQGPLRFGALAKPVCRRTGTFSRQYSPEWKFTDQEKG